MNTIPLTFNERPIDCTVLGGSKFPSETESTVGVALINCCGNHMRLQNLETLIKCGFDQIISMESDSDNYNIKDFVQKFPSVRFVIPLEKVTYGELINMAMSQFTTRYVLIINDLIDITYQTLVSTVVKRLAETGVYCIAPRLVTDGNQGLPVKFIPRIQKSQLKVDSSAVISEGSETLYPFDFIGLYNRKKFIDLGGFDYTITSPHWQNLDLSFRAWLFGEKINLSPYFLLSYAAEVPVENVTPDLGQLRFFLKNIAVQFEEDHGELPCKAFFPYMLHSSCGVVENIRQFKAARRWVRKNQYRFKTDASALIANWQED